MKTIFQFLLLFFCAISFSQTTITGAVVDDNNQPIPGANIIVVGTSSGTVTDFDGNFILNYNQIVPFKVQASSVGFESMTIEVTENNQILNFILNEGTSLDEIVISASRTPESIRESPVTIERFDIKDIQYASSPDFYSSLENLKGVDVNKGSLTFNAVNTRGFATFSNTRFVQLVDGMDNSLPGLNFALGNILGLSELDISSVEILPGASSALYGANAFNGILFMTSKDPFTHQGVSAYVKTGLTVQDEAGDNQFHDFGFRAAHAFSDKFAAKASFSYLRGTDWFASDNNQYTLGAVGTADIISSFRSDPAHDGLNIYGDEVALAANETGQPQNLNEVAQFLEANGILPTGASGLVPAVNVARTGYKESDLTDYKAESIKAYFTLNYRPFGNNTEIIWSSKIGKGSSIYQGSNRYAIKDFALQQHKLEFRGDNFFLRGYTTIENAGNSYDMRFTGINMNKVGASEWFGAYAAAYAQGAGQIAGSGGNINDLAIQTQIHNGARTFADNLYTPQPGTPEFIALFNKVTNDPDITTGSKLVDESKMDIAEGNYNFRDLLNNVIDLQIGGQYRQYSLNSSGSVFTDYDGSIDYNEYGAYLQGIKKLMDDRLKITASIRYDKNEFFDGSYSPRLSLVYAAGENKQHNFRASLQTGFRNPDTQALFIGFDVGRAILVGSAPDNLDRKLPNTTLTGRDAYFNAYTLSSVQGFAASGGTTSLVPVNGNGITSLAKQEKVTAFDVGYRGKIEFITVDLNAYFNTYDNFSAQKFIVTPKSGSVNDASGVIDVATGNFQVFNVYTNSSADISSYGGVIGLSTKIAREFNLGFNYTYSELDFDQSTDPDFSAGFNTPKHKVKVSLGNPELFKNFGFNVNARWSDKYFWQATIANAIISARTVVDAQINYSVPSMKSTFKIGGTNLGGKEYQSAVGSPFIGSQYFVSWIINN
ncbi:TonB-dependent receptor [Thalassobellus suaedae]|uniref:Carboxypeptidase-like regulatory domain-containing protein n=1 Tax=Thalassobellus suaedae TaxID=3074124 RepID=A0ABY9Y6W7_9FLAO|nr:carboxypeptidase-like regulatory domain-containing protein [Flavobacteriaceae bacterium HL-DH10]